MKAIPFLILILLCSCAKPGEAGKAAEQVQCEDVKYDPSTAKWLVLQIGIYQAYRAKIQKCGNCEIADVNGNTYIHCE